MTKLLHVVAFAAAALGLSAPAWADISVKDATGATIATCSTTSSSTQVPCHQLKNAAGTTINPATAEAQATGNGSIATLAGTVGAPGSAAPGTAQQAAGVGPAGNLRALATGTNGGLLPDQAAPVSTRTTLTAGTATQLDAARAGRLLATVQVETSPTAPVFICFTQGTGCSATSYDVMIASGAAVASLYTAPFGATGAVYAFSTAAPVLNVSSWIAQ